MDHIGGFFGLDVPSGPHRHHPGALRLSTGRACLAVVLDVEEPAVVHAPLLSCDAAIAPILERDAELRLFRLDDALRPVGLPDPLPRDHLVVWPNLYGVHDELTAELVERFGSRVVVDDTHAFDRGRHGAHVWSFTSARKHAGVPDGAFLFLPRGVEPPSLPSAAAVARTDHLSLRTAGAQSLAYAAFRSHEERLGTDVEGMSPVAERLLTHFDADAAARRRHRNHGLLHGRLAQLNGLRAAAHPNGTPFCYPLLLEREVSRDQLAAQGVYVPVMWREVLARDGAGPGTVEHALVTRLLPLPLDHRYGEREMERVADVVEAAVERAGPQR